MRLIVIITHRPLIPRWRFEQQQQSKVVHIFFLFPFFLALWWPSKRGRRGESRVGRGEIFSSPASAGANGRVEIGFSSFGTVCHLAAWLARLCVYVFVQCMWLLLAVELLFFFSLDSTRARVLLGIPLWVVLKHMINYDLVPSLFDPRVEGGRKIGKTKQTKDKLRIQSKRRIFKRKEKYSEKTKYAERTMRLIVPAPPDVGTMRRQATSSITNPASLIPTSGATSSSSSSSPVNIVNYRRLYNECSDG